MIEAEVSNRAQLNQITLQVLPVISMDDDQFFNLCQLNRELRIERTLHGEITIMTPVGGETSRKNARIIMALGIWAEQDGRGIVFDSSGGFVLANGAIRSPDAAWVLRSRLAELSAEEKQRFLPLCPDFVVELRSLSDSVAHLQDKMAEYIENGVRMAWLIDPEHRLVQVHEPERTPVSLSDPLVVSGGSVLPGFELELTAIWQPAF